MFAENYHEQVGAVIGGLLDKFILGGTLACTQLHAHVAAVAKKGEKGKKKLLNFSEFSILLKFC